MKHSFILLITAIFFTAIQAQPGTLDKTYGNGGWTYYPISKIVINTSAIQADNKVINAGSDYTSSQTDFALIRNNPDGSVDKSFGNEGEVRTSFSQYYQSEGWTSVKVQPDGKIVAAGTNYIDDIDNYPPYDADIALARFNADGTPDLTFGKNGVVITDFGEYETANAMTLQPDGRIVVTGTYSLRGIGYDSKVITVRYNTDGSLDNSFGEGKSYVVFPGSGVDNAFAIAIQEDDKIVVGGNYEINRYFLLIRYNKDGSLDNSFGGGNGFVNTKIVTDGRPTDESINSLAIDKEGRIIAAGTCLNVYMAAARYKPDGTLDSSFNGNGKQVLILGSYAEARKVLLLKDERILLSGFADNVASPMADQALVCLTPGGALDSSFGKNGEIVTSFGGAGSVSNSAVLQTDGKIVVTGSYESGSFYSYLLARYNGYDPGKQTLTVRIKRWLLHHGISWQVQQSKNMRYYAVQRSADGIVYKEIAKLSNKTQVDKYEDPTITGGSYYRLAAIGWDGSRTYSNAILIDESTNVKVFPNPVRDNLQLQGLSEGKTSVSIVDLQGNVRSSAVAAGSNYSINTSQLTPGNYLLKLQHNSTITTQPFVKE